MNKLGEGEQTELSKYACNLEDKLAKCEQKLEKIKELCQVPNEPYYNSECEFGKGRIDLGQEILEIIEGAEE